MTEHLLGLAVCAVWALIGYMVGLDEGMSRND